MKPLLGWIEPKDRNQFQNDAHAASLQTMVKFALQPVKLAKGQKLSLFDLWRNPDVVADVGFVYNRIHQITGSCVWAGGTNALYSTICAQRVAGENPTKAFLPMTLHNYGLSRHYYGANTPGEGSMGSTFAKSLKVDGVDIWNPTKAPYKNTDGIIVGREMELYYSGFQNNKDIKETLLTSKAHLLGSAAECNTIEQIKTLVINGYGVAFACGRFIGNASIRGSGANACVMGKWDSRGGHQQSIHAVWEHPDFGPLLWAQNSWPGSVYPKDPAGGPICGCWVKEDDVQDAMNDSGEVYGYSSLDWFPAQPKLLDWLI